MTGLELLKAPEATAGEIADIISAPCPPTIPAHCDGVSCRACWLAWLTGEPLKGKEPPDKRTAPDDAPAYEKAAPPREYAAMLLMKAATARVTNQGINKFGTLYTDTELAYYVNQKVNIKWDIDDVTKLYVYDMDGKKICEAVSAELLAFGPHCSQAALEKHLRDQKRNEREVREYLEERVRPYELRLEDGARPSDAVGMIDLTIKATPSQKLVSLPKDRMFRSEQASKASRKKVTDDTFLNAKGDKALSLLRAMNE